MRHGSRATGKASDEEHQWLAGKVMDEVPASHGQQMKSKRSSASCWKVFFGGFGLGGVAVMIVTHYPSNTAQETNLSLGGELKQGSGRIALKQLDSLLRHDERHASDIIDCGIGNNLAQLGKACQQHDSLEKLACMKFEPSYVLDVGANLGHWTRKYLQTFRKAKFIMLDGANHDDDWKEVLRSGRVSGTEALLDNEDHVVEWYQSGGSTGNSIFKETTGHIFTPIQKQAYRLDGLLHRMQWGYNFELVKIDVQGAELAILKGAPKVLKNAQVIRMELPFAGEYNKGAPTFAQYVEFMDHAGFFPFDIPELHRMRGVLGQIDFLWVRKWSQWHNISQCVLRSLGPSR